MTRSYSLHDEATGEVAAAPLYARWGCTRMLRDAQDAFRGAVAQQAAR